MKATQLARLNLAWSKVRNALTKSQQEKLAKAVTTIDDVLETTTDTRASTNTDENTRGRRATPCLHLHWPVSGQDAANLMTFRDASALLSIRETTLRCLMSQRNGEVHTHDKEGRVIIITKVTS